MFDSPSYADKSPATPPAYPMLSAEPPTVTPATVEQISPPGHVQGPQSSPQLRVDLILDFPPKFFITISSSFSFSFMY